MEELKQEQIEQAIEIIKEHRGENICVDLLKRYMNHPSTITANRLLEALENAEIISESNNGKRNLLYEGNDRVVVINIKDELGIHALQANSFIVKCKECGKERYLLKSDMQGNNIKPIKCKCGGENEFRYWLDFIYNESEYEELERQANSKK